METDSMGFDAVFVVLDGEEHSGNAGGKTPNTEGKTPNTKHQTPTNFQTPNSNGVPARAAAGWKVEGWCLVGVWCLVFGVYSVRPPLP